METICFQQQVNQKNAANLKTRAMTINWDQQVLFFEIPEEEGNQLVLVHLICSQF